MQSNQYRGRGIVIALAIVVALLENSNSLEDNSIPEQALHMILKIEIFYI